MDKKRTIERALSILAYISVGLILIPNTDMVYRYTVPPSIGLYLSLAFFLGLAMAFLIIISYVVLGLLGHLQKPLFKNFTFYLLLLVFSSMLVLFLYAATTVLGPGF